MCAVKIILNYVFYLHRQLLTSEEVESIKSEISAIVAKWYTQWLETGMDGNDWETAANREPAWKEGRWQPASDKPADIELGFRRLYRMTLESQLFDRIAKHEKVRYGGDLVLNMQSLIIAPLFSVKNLNHKF